MTKILDPLVFAKVMWPGVEFYREQREVIYSVMENDETFVPAGNMLGKDFVTAFICLHFFLTRHPCRVVTTSVDQTQLEGVLWGEIRRFIQTATYPLEHTKGGPLVVNHLHLRKVIHLPSGHRGGSVAPVVNAGGGVGHVQGMCGISYMIGRVAAKGEGMLGHHVADVGDGIPRTLMACDEASGVADISYERSDTWARRKLIIGNPYPGAPGCTFFQRGVEGGDLLAPPPRTVTTQ